MCSYLCSGTGRIPPGDLLCVHICAPKLGTFRQVTCCVFIFVLQAGHIPLGDLLCSYLCSSAGRIPPGDLLCSYLCSGAGRIPPGDLLCSYLCSGTGHIPPGDLMCVHICALALGTFHQVTCCVFIFVFPS